MAYSPKFVRKKLFINKKFQSKFIFRFSIFVLLGTLILSVFLFYTSHNSTTIVFTDLRLKSLPTHEYLMPSLFAGLILALTCTSIFTIFTGLIYSHRIAGPMFRFEAMLKKFKEGDLTQQAHLRNFDEWKDTATILNEAIFSVKDRMKNIDLAVKELEKQTSHYDPKIASQIDKIKAELKTLTY